MSHINYGVLLNRLGRLQEAEEHYGPSRASQEGARAGPETCHVVWHTVLLTLQDIMFQVATGSISFSKINGLNTIDISVATR